MSRRMWASIALSGSWLLLSALVFAGRFGGDPIGALEPVSWVGSVFAVVLVIVAVVLAMPRRAASTPAQLAEAEREDFQATFKAFPAEAIKQQKRMADRAMVQFVALRLVLVVASASLPALTTVPDRSWSTVAAILVAVLASLDTQFRWGEEWRHYRSTQLALERIRRNYERRRLALAYKRRVSGIKTEEENFDRPLTGVEEVLQAGTDRFFKFRITPWHSKDDKQ